jgi:hypothetical protein
MINDDSPLLIMNNHNYYTINHIINDYSTKWNNIHHFHDVHHYYTIFTIIDEDYDHHYEWLVNHYRTNHDFHELHHDFHHYETTIINHY